MFVIHLDAKAASVKRNADACALKDIAACSMFGMDNAVSNARANSSAVVAR